MTAKLFQPDSDGPDAKLEVESAGPYTRLYLFEKTASGWEATGLAELHPALEPDYSGGVEPGIVLEWAYTQCHAAGDRTKVSHRVRVCELGDGLEVRHEHAREQVLGHGDRDEHDWRTLECWWVRPTGVETREVGVS
ncbi:hypothetical protein ACFQO4_20745 [Saliphagus sp. GCM10025334]